jgi:hypothetical protein
MIQARATVAGVHADQQRWKAEQRHRDGADRFVTKTVDHARVADAPQQQTMDAQTASWVGWVDERINGAVEVCAEEINKLLDKVYDDFGRALAKRDQEIKLLRDEIEIKIGLGRKLARLKAEVAEARQQAPNFKAELARLQEENAQQEKRIVRLRAQNSMLEYQQKQVDKELSQMKRESASSAVVEFQTASARFTVGNLHPDAANALREFASQVVDAYDGDPILFSRPAGTA